MSSAGMLHLTSEHDRETIQEWYCLWFFCGKQKSRIFLCKKENIIREKTIMRQLINKLTSIEQTHSNMWNVESRNDILRAAKCESWYIFEWAKLIHKKSYSLLLSLFNWNNFKLPAGNITLLHLFVHWNVTTSWFKPTNAILLEIKMSKRLLLLNSQHIIQRKL